MKEERNKQMEDFRANIINSYKNIESKALMNMLQYCNDKEEIERRNCQAHINMEYTTHLGIINDINEYILSYTLEHEVNNLKDFNDDVKAIIYNKILDLNIDVKSPSVIDSRLTTGYVMTHELATMLNEYWQ